MADSNMINQTNDIERVSELETLDPGYSDSLYWARFQRTVLERAADELRRRRDAVQITVADALSGWGRMIVPAAVMAAALAGVMLMDSARPASDAVVVQEILDESPSLPETLEAEFLTSVAAAASGGENF